MKEKGILTSLVVNLQYWLSLVYPLTFANIPVFLIAYQNYGSRYIVYKLFSVCLWNGNILTKA